MAADPFDMLGGDPFAKGGAPHARNDAVPAHPEIIRGDLKKPADQIKLSMFLGVEGGVLEQTERVLAFLVLSLPLFGLLE